MNAFSKLLLAILIGSLISCGTSTTDTATRLTPLIAKDTTNPIEKNNTLFVFVGEKIEVTPVPLKPGSFDNGVKAKYKILQPVYGNYNKDVIEFEAYDHYGTPKFTEYKTVLLFVSEYKGKYYQEKYEFDPLFKTKDGRWAGPYSEDYEHPYNKHTTVKPEKIDFAEDVSFPTKMKYNDDKEYSVSYPEPYYKMVGDRAVAIYGNYVPELFKLKKDGVLTARDLFGGDKPAITDVELEKSKGTIDKK